jgi:hypothetical protein
VNSGTIAHLGLLYVHDMIVDYLLPSGASYVEGSARFVAGTGTPNVLAGRRLLQHGGVLTLSLPGRVQNGTDYTPPSVIFELRAVAAPGDRALVSFKQFRLTANAFMVGDVSVSCAPVSTFSDVGSTLITSPP